MDLIFGLVVILIVGSSVANYFYIKNKAISSKKNISIELTALKKEVIVVTTNTIPTKNIINVLGVVSGTSDIEAKTKEEFELAEKEAMYTMMTEAKNIGANAIIEAKINTGTYGVAYQVSSTTYNGTAVIIE